MNIFKRLAPLAIAAAMAMTLPACGSPSNPPTSSDNRVTASQTTTQTQPPPTASQTTTQTQPPPTAPAPTPPATEADEWEQAYAPVLNQYRQLVAWDSKNRNAFFETDAGHAYDSDLISAYVESTHIVYALFDMDNDGKPELVLGASWSSETSDVSPQSIWALDINNSPVFAYQHPRISAIGRFEIFRHDGRIYTFSGAGDDGFSHYQVVLLHSDAVVAEIVPNFRTGDGYVNPSICDQDNFSKAPLSHETVDGRYVSYSYGHNGLAVSEDEYLAGLAEYSPAIIMVSADATYHGRPSVVSPVQLDWKNL